MVGIQNGTTVLVAQVLAKLFWLTKFKLVIAMPPDGQLNRSELASSVTVVKTLDPAVNGK